MAQPITIVVIRSLSYSGTTWVNCILSSHERALFLGPPERAWRMEPEKANETCLLHHAGCTFWPRFVRSWKREESFFVQLSAYSGKDVLILNNPTSDLVEKEFNHPELCVKLIKLVRDGRANTASMVRHHPERYASFYDALNQWLRPALERLRAVRYEQTGGERYFRYEDFVLNPRDTLGAVGDYIGLTYPQNGLHYWEFDHHPSAGNSGMIDTLLRLKGMESFSHHRKPFYDRLVRQLADNPGKPLMDESWKGVLTRKDRFTYDYLMGDIHEDLGYARDVFSTNETEAFLQQMGCPPNREKRPQALDSSRYDRDFPTRFQVDIDRVPPLHAALSRLFRRLASSSRRRLFGRRCG